MSKLPDRSKKDIPAWMPPISIESIDVANHPGLEPGKYPYEKVSKDTFGTPQKHEEFHGHQY